MAGLYAESGVDYEYLDSGKHAAVAAARTTDHLIERLGARALGESRGESAFVFELEGRHFAFVLECLGTKSAFARQVYEETGENRFADVGYDTVACIVNDLICVGALPAVMNAYFATGSSDWYADKNRANALVEGFRKGCEDAGATWGGGESPGLKGLVNGPDIELAGSCVGLIPKDHEPLLGDELAAGDSIVLIGSSGIHTNGISLARKAVEDLPDGMGTKLSDGRTLGDAICTPSLIYAQLVEKLLENEIPVTYLVHLTGHGFRKIMRPSLPFTYRVGAVPNVPEELQFLANHFGMMPADAYATFNMGVGFVVYCRSEAASQVVQLAKAGGLDALVAGEVEDGPRQVIIDPLDVHYSDEDYTAPGG